MKRFKKLYLHLRHSTMLIFAIGVVSTYVIEYVLSQYSTRLGILATLVMTIMLLMGIFLIYELLVWLLGRLFTKKTPPIGDQPPQHKALLLLLGLHGEETAAVAIDHHLPILENVWFLVTEDTRPIARKLKETFNQEARFNFVDIADYLKPNATQASIIYAVEQLEALRLHSDDIIADITGGTSAMTAGAVLGAIEKEIDLEMVAATYDLGGDVKHTLNVIRLEINHTR